MITPSNQVFKDVDFDMEIGIGTIGNQGRKSAERNDTVKKTAGC